MHHCSRIEPAALMHQLGGQGHSLNRFVLSRFAEHADDHSTKLTVIHLAGGARGSVSDAIKLRQSSAQFTTALIQMTRLRIISSALNREGVRGDLL